MTNNKSDRVIRYLIGKLKGVGAASRLSIVNCQLSIFILLLAACSSDEGGFPDGLITPTCSVYAPDLEVNTRGDGVKGSGSALASVRVFRADQTLASAWPATCNGLTSSQASVNASGQVTFSTGQEMYYQANGKDTRLLGLHPYTAATVNTSNQITCSIDGSTDLMATAWSTEAANRHSGTVHPSLTFNHLLTQLIVSVVAENQAAIDTWGTISSITLDGMKNSCVVTLPVPTATTKPAVTSSSGTENFTVRDIDGKAISTGKTITTKEVVYGYGMIVPTVISSPSSQLEVTVATSKATSTVPFPASGVSTTYTFEAGKAYTLLLKMTATAIVPSVSISAWTESDVNPNGNADLGGWGSGSMGGGNVNL